MKKHLLLLVLFFSIILINSIKGQNEDLNNLSQDFVKLYTKGDLVRAEDKLLQILKSKRTAPDDFIIATYNNLGATNTLLGKYSEALDYYNQAESLSINKSSSISLADLYINEAIIYGFQKSYQSAIDYFEKGIRTYLKINNKEKKIFQNISSGYLDIGVVYYEIKNYKTASDYLNKSAELKLKYNLSGLALAYLNIAKTFAKTGNSVKAEEFYLKSISTFQHESGNEYYRMAEVYFDYGLFLRSLGRNSEALSAHRKALSICLKNYGEKHTLTSLSYKHIGDHYLNQNNCDSALYYYQKSLIAVVRDFNNPDILSNPSPDSAIFNIRLLDNLKSKARALELFAGQQNEPELKLKTTRKSLETIDIAMNLIDRIRNSYLSEESRMYLSENEKETYVLAVHLAQNLFNLTKDDSTKIKMYDNAKKAKASVLRNEITENELVYSSGIPDSLRNKKNLLSGDISAYNNLILEEMRKKDPDNKKISLWKDAIFDMNREKERVSDLINKEYPQYHDLLQKTEPVSLEEIQKNLNKKEAVIDYLLSNQYSDGKRKLYIFFITKNRLEFCEKEVDSLFSKNLDIIYKANLQTQSSGKSDELFRGYTSSLFYMYENLIKPVEPLLSGERLIIIPDEEIGRLPFDAFLKSKPSPDQTDYEGLDFLVNHYAFSFGYSSSLIFRREPELKGEDDVYAFLPDYATGNLLATMPANLQGAANEIDAVFRLFGGKKFIGDRATETNFREAMRHPAIFHLAMHSLADSSNSRYSYLMFDPRKDSLNDGKLFNYEISTSRIKSPMVVLSACNSGTGTLYHGEGVMSLARGFILAGASSVIKTSWDVNDAASAAIIKGFYFHLSKGESKDMAMCSAKLDYIKSNPPIYSNPYYWAAYEVLGDNSPVVRNKHKGLIIIILILIVSAGLTAIYFKRRIISPDRSL